MDDKQLELELPIEPEVVPDVIMLPEPIRYFEGLDSKVLLYIYDALICDDKIFVPLRYLNASGKQFCGDLKHALEIELSIRDIDTVTATQVVTTTIDLIPR